MGGSKVGEGRTLGGIGHLKLCGTERGTIASFSMINCLHAHSNGILSIRDLAGVQLKLLSAPSGVRREPFPQQYCLL